MYLNITTTTGAVIWFGTLLGSFHRHLYHQFWYIHVQFSFRSMWPRMLFYDCNNLNHLIVELFA